MMYASLGSRNLQIKALRKSFVISQNRVNTNVNDIGRIHCVSRKDDGDQRVGSQLFSDATRKRHSWHGAIIVKFTLYRSNDALMRNKCRKGDC